MSVQEQEQHTDPLTDHAYDGIQEYDNPVPSWWTWLFVGTIAFSVVYTFVILLTNEQLSPRGIYARAEQHRMATMGVYEPTVEMLATIKTTPNLLSAGEAIYLTNCATCHGDKGQGGTGPNLTDNSFLNIEKPEDYFDVIANGRKNGAMPAWGTRLPPNDQVLVAGYVAALRGRNIAGKGPEGKEIPPFGF